jgi:hypothetical protein
VAAINNAANLFKLLLPSSQRLRQYLPKGVSMAGLSQQQCNAIARKLNTRPRKRLGFRTPLECFNESYSVLHFNVDVRPRASLEQNAANVLLAPIVNQVCLVGHRPLFSSR